MVSNPFFVQSVSSMQMSSISQMMLGRKRACYKSLSGKDILVYQLMEYYSILYISPFFSSIGIFLARRSPLSSTRWSTPTAPRTRSLRSAESRTLCTSSLFPSRTASSCRRDRC